MFLGTYTPKLDDKGRLTLPAKFRDALAGGLMVTKSQDHSLAVYPRAQFEQGQQCFPEQPGGPGVST
jgi:MraZ protein